MSTSEGYHEYFGGCSVHRRDTMSKSGDIMSTSGDIMSTSGMFSTSGDIMIHVGDTMSTSRDVQYIGGIP